jgi:hypothetical protein
MHTHDVVDLAAFISAQGPAFLSGAQHPPETSLAQYWTLSKCRLDRWNRSLRQLQTSGRAFAQGANADNHGLQSLCEEIIVSEMVTRVWSSLLTAFDYLSGGGEAQPVASNVLSGHLEASNRVLNIIAYNRHHAKGPEADLNRLRRLTERWTDMLLGSLGTQIRADDFAHVPARAEEFSHDFDRSRQPGLRKQAWGLVAASLRETFEPHLNATAPNADLNTRIGGSILACFPAEVFDSTGMYHGLWDLRVTTMASDAQQLVEQLLAADSGSPISTDR